MVKKAILIVGHGSRYGYNKAIMELQKSRLEEMGFENVYIGFNETSSPKIADSMQAMAADGVDEVVAIPFFIASGLHMTRDIPPKLGLKDGKKEDCVEVCGRRMKVSFEEPFGRDPLLATLLKERIDEEMKTGNAVVIVVGHGSRLPYNKEIITLNADRLKDMGYDAVFPAFNEFDEPDLKGVFDGCLAAEYDEILVLPLFISLGDHLKNDIPPKIRLKDGEPEGFCEYGGRKVRVAYLPPVGEDPRLTELFAAKARRHLRGGRMDALVLDMTHGGHLVAERLKDRGWNATCVDVYHLSTPEARSRLADRGIEVSYEAPRKHFDAVFMPAHCPDSFIGEAAADKRYTFSEAVKMLIGDGLPFRIEVTGVKGKTSTCYLIAHILDACGRKVFLHTSRGQGPYVGSHKVTELKSIAPPYIMELPSEGYDVVISEVSLGGSGKADIALITNLVEDYGIAKDSRKASYAKAQILSDRGRNVVKEDEYGTWHSKRPDLPLETYRNVCEAVEKPALGKPLRIRYEYLGKTEEAVLGGSFLAIQYLLSIDAALKVCELMDIPADDVRNALGTFRGVPGRGEVSQSGGVWKVNERNPGISHLSIDMTMRCLKEMDALDGCLAVVDPVSRRVCDKMHPELIRSVLEKYGVEYVITDGNGGAVDTSGHKAVVTFVKEAWQ
jgi:sirohydrochlorin ferrochelatase